MTRNAALETAYRLAASSGVPHRLYRDWRGRWHFSMGYFLVPDSYQVGPDGRATRHLLGQPPRGMPVEWEWSNPRLAH